MFIVIACFIDVFVVCVFSGRLYYICDFRIALMEYNCECMASTAIPNEDFPTMINDIMYMVALPIHMNVVY